MKDVGRLYRCPRCADGVWHALAADHHANHSACFPAPTNLQNLSWVRGPVWANMADVWKEPDAWTERTMALLNWGTGRRGLLGAAKIAGDGRLGQCPSGEFIKDDGLFCGCCLPRDMNVIRAQLKGQGCTFKYHWTLQESNVPLRKRLTGAPSSYEGNRRVYRSLC